MGCDSIRFSSIRTADLVLSCFRWRPDRGPAKTLSAAAQARRPVEGEAGLVVSIALGVKSKVSALSYG